MIASRPVLRRCTTLFTSNSTSSSLQHQLKLLHRTIFTRQLRGFSSPLLPAYSNCATSSIAAGALIATSVVFFATFSTTKSPLLCGTSSDMAPSIQTNGTSSGPKKHKVVSGKKQNKSLIEA